MSGHPITAVKMMRLMMSIYKERKTKKAEQWVCGGGTGVKHLMLLAFLMYKVTDIKYSTGG